jgi:hypothetical protein
MLVLAWYFTSPTAHEQAEREHDLHADDRMFR